MAIRDLRMVRSPVSEDFVLATSPLSDTSTATLSAVEEAMRRSEKRFLADCGFSPYKF